MASPLQDSQFAAIDLSESTPRLLDGSILLRVGLTQATTTLRRLILKNGVLDSEKICQLSRFRELRELIIRNVIFFAGSNVDLAELTPKLELLHIDRCPQLPQNGFEMILGLRLLKNVIYRTYRIDMTDVDYFNRTTADISLDLMGQRRPEERALLLRIGKLRSLCFRDFDFVNVRDDLIEHSYVQSVSFIGGLELVCRVEDQGRPLLPNGVRQLAIRKCQRIDRRVLNNFLQLSGHQLIELTLHLHIITDAIPLRECKSLRFLDIFGYKDFDGDFLSQVGCLSHLKQLRFGGSISLTTEHLIPLLAINLEEVRISNSFLLISEDGHSVLELLNSGSSLKVKDCHAISIPR